jgi:hypothetical protein
LGALPTWFEKRGKSLDAIDVAIRYVGGASQFEHYVRLLHGFGVPWAIYCDGDYIADPPPPWKSIANQLRDAGVESAPDVSSLNFAERRTVLANVGVFTTADSAKDRFETIPEVQRIRRRVPPENRGSKPLEGRWIAEQIDCPPEVADVQDSVLAHLL